ncbi:helix-turn-helix domain-containing protein [Limnospira maxima]|uniref:helix-turn-helix domain-containing protein n=2 Tax=Limnospira TaxID=2596745 RepID=UPI001F4863B4|nr:helix-turn-helix domain-containing protein [Limnospira maxima]
MYPSPELNQVWRKWLAACRYCYNQAIALSRSGKRLSKLKLRWGSDAERLTRMGQRNTLPHSAKCHL